jgi:hypothetical protein
MRTQMGAAQSYREDGITPKLHKRSQILREIIAILGHYIRRESQIIGPNEALMEVGDARSTVTCSA